MDAGATTFIALAVALLGALGGIAALLKVRPESGRMIVEAAEGAVVVQAGVMKELREELAAIRLELDETRDELRTAAEDERQCQARCTRLEAELRDVRATLKRHGLNGEAVERQA